MASPTPPTIVGREAATGQPPLRERGQREEALPLRRRHPRLNMSGARAEAATGRLPKTRTARGGAATPRRRPPPTDVGREAATGRAPTMRTARGSATQRGRVGAAGDDMVRGSATQRGRRSVGRHGARLRDAARGTQRAGATWREAARGGAGRRSVGRHGAREAARGGAGRHSVWDDMARRDTRRRDAARRGAARGTVRREAARREAVQRGVASSLWRAAGRGTGFSRSARAWCEETQRSAVEDARGGEARGR
jgi:hypothetical protein